MPKVEVYTKDYCPYCKAAISLLEERKIEFVEYDVTHDEAKREEMLSRSEGRTTVPEIFINGKHVGGFTDLQELDDSGKLDELLKA